MTYDAADDSRKSYDLAISEMRKEYEALKAPFPWFGGKNAVAPIVWERLGNVPNYVEPFFGSGAMLLRRPHAPKIETVNDLDHMLANFWRAVKHSPAEVEEHCDWPVNEDDLQARHYWLITQGKAKLESILGDPDGYDAKIAGWWVWGICSWIGSGWCSGKGPWSWDGQEWVKADDAGQGINRQLPHLGDGGQGINRQLPHLGDAGQGINRKLPHLGNAGQGINRKLTSGMMQALSDRLRNVRVCSGDWSRVTGPSVTWNNGSSRGRCLTGVFLDPPYADTAERTSDLYASDSLTVAHDVRRWAIEQGDNPLMRICLAGYTGEHDLPSTWKRVLWKAQGGYGTQSDNTGRANAVRECLWFSPHCLDGRQGSMFDMMEQSA